MKNWLPLVSAPEFAIARVPLGYSGGVLGLALGEALGFGSGSGGVGLNSSPNLYAGPPWPVPDGSPHCSTKMPAVVSRWHLLPLKNCLPARNEKLVAVHGASVRSSCASTTPWFVVIVMVSMPDLPIAVVAGRPT